MSSSALKLAQRISGNFLFRYQLINYRIEIKQKHVKAITAPELIKCADDTIDRPFKDSDDMVERLCLLLKKSTMDCRVNLMRHLINNRGINVKSLKSMSLKAVTCLESYQVPGEDIAAAKRLSDSALPAYKYLFEKIARNSDGIRILVELRAIILEKLLNVNDPNCVKDTVESARLHFMSNVLRELFMLWFSPALLQLQRLSWDFTPASLLESVALSPAVHPVKNWIDLKRRMHDADRRCFVFTHPSLPSQSPVIILYVALMPEIPGKMSQILGVSAEDNEESNTDLQKAAIFYSITSQNKGLNGIDLGHSLIKQVMSVLRSESPHLTEFSTLSPIPRFLHWLGRGTRSFGEDLAFTSLGKLPNAESIPSYMERMLQDPNKSFPDTFQNDLLRLGARYLCTAKHRGFAFDPVAHFHLRNGAEIFRINWLGDTSIKGLQQSGSLMVNYRYYPERLEKNAHAYAVDRHIAMSSEVKSLLL